MKRLIVLAALAMSLCAPAALGQAVYEDRTNTPTNMYITSMYRVRVYLNNRIVDILPPGKYMQSSGNPAPSPANRVSRSM